MSEVWAATPSSFPSSSSFDVSDVSRSASQRARAASAADRYASKSLRAGDAKLARSCWDAPFKTNAAATATSPIVRHA